MDKGRTVARTAAFAVFNVGASVALSKNEMNLDIRFINLGEPHDLSHTGIYGLVDNAAKSARILAESVKPDEVYPAG